MLVRADLAPGCQLAQAVHAAIGLAQDPVPVAGGDSVGTGPPTVSAELPVTVVVLAVPDEASLISWSSVGDGGHLFREPDLGGQATAFAVVSDGVLFSDLRLALEGAMV